MQLLLPMLMPVMKKTLLAFKGLYSFTGPKLVQVLIIKCYQCFKEETNLAA